MIKKEKKKERNQIHMFFNILRKKTEKLILPYRGGRERTGKNLRFGKNNPDRIRKQTLSRALVGSIYIQFWDRQQCPVKTRSQDHSLDWLRKL